MAYKSNHIKRALLLTLLVLIIPVFPLKAETYVKKLKQVSLGVDSVELVTKVGEPTNKETVIRYYYGKNEAIVIDSTIKDIRLAESHKKIKIRLKREKRVEKESSPIAMLRIGMPVSEALERAGAPDSILQGEDWYYSDRNRVELVQGKVRHIEVHLKSSLETLDWVWLNFTNGGLLFMNLTLAFIMFGVALQIKLEHFKLLIVSPKPVVLGFVSQFIALPFFTFILVLIIRPTPSVAMGMILVAACPGGNISNFISSMAKGNVALSVTLTAIATVAAVFMTPFNFAFWGKLYSEASNLVIPIEIDAWEMIKTVLILLGVPIVLGMLFAKKFPVTTEKVLKPIKVLSIVFFMGFVVAAFASNFQYFLKYIHLIALIVIAHNALGLGVGYLIPKLFKLPQKDRRTIAIETGIQNSGLGLVLIFNPNLFDGLGGMAFIAAAWGIWHIISGLSLAYFWSRRPPVEA
ncbi:MAG TPA: bile acid:sodium symporter family protein [Tenuifilaceae bacterium]|nr:bile acid:sodium symporter family protein [Tenuifilaceae bacterium]HPI45996.1 bile acid:sodium symporter family protein [Tenuifilaceae bacterium]HPN21261.1 bile acid:sodium symporter family protein [Tenuifilaceae bacterium]